jgi:hypothetical protein
VSSASPGQACLWAQETTGLVQCTKICRRSVWVIHTQTGRNWRPSPGQKVKSSVRLTHSVGHSASPLENASCGTTQPTPPNSRPCELQNIGKRMQPHRFMFDRPKMESPPGRRKNLACGVVHYLIPANPRFAPLHQTFWPASASQHDETAFSPHPKVYGNAPVNPTNLAIKFTRPSANLSGEVAAGEVLQPTRPP